MPSHITDQRLRPAHSVLSWKMKLPVSTAPSVNLFVEAMPAPSMKLFIKAIPTPSMKLFIEVTLGASTFDVAEGIQEIPGCFLVCPLRLPWQCWCITYGSSIESRKQALLEIIINHFVLVKGRSNSFRARHLGHEAQEEYFGHEALATRMP